MSQIGIDDMGVALPPGQAVADLIIEAGKGHDVVATVHNNGLSSVPVADTGTLVDLVIDAVQPLLDRHPGLPQQVALVLLAHSAPLLAPADEALLSEILDRAGLVEAAAFAVTGQPCAVLHSAVHWAMDSDCLDSDGAAVLVIGADRANHPVERVFFGSTMGDAAVALLLGRRSSRRRIVGRYVHAELHASEGEWSDPTDILRFRERNPLLIRGAIEQCVGQAGYSLRDVAAIIPHTPYLAIWDVIAELLCYPRSQILTDYIAKTGHLSSNDSFVHFHSAQREGRLSPGDLALLINPGFGGARGCTLIRV
jgi:3-oxoacyl-[acyl-carrier-protein] synthase-3